MVYMTPVRGLTRVSPLMAPAVMALTNRSEKEEVEDEHGQGGDH